MEQINYTDHSLMLNVCDSLMHLNVQSSVGRADLPCSRTQIEDVESFWRRSLEGSFEVLQPSLTIFSPPPACRCSRTSPAHSCLPTVSLQSMNHTKLLFLKLPFVRCLFRAIRKVANTSTKMLTFTLNYARP